VQNPRIVAKIPVETETISELRAARQKSSSAKIVSYQWVVNPSSGMVGNRAELNENTMLKKIGAKTNPNSSAI